MASQTQGIQQLLAAEKRAAEKVAEARKRKARRLKQAKEEAKDEIEKYRQEREKQFKEFEAKHMGSKEDVAARIDADAKIKIEEMGKAVARNKQAVIQEILGLVYDIKPELHKNYQMTGLNPECDEIMEVACVVTTPELECKKDGYQAIINVPDAKLATMDEWCTKQHALTGLTEECRKSKVTLAKAESQLYDYIQQQVQPKDLLYMAGNTIYMDRMFLKKYMPRVDAALHYRMVDVSSVKTLCQHWYSAQKVPPKVLAHRALGDVYESIEELRYYRANIFR